jgi:hypothetical protein
MKKRNRSEMALRSQVIIRKRNRSEMALRSQVIFKKKKKEVRWLSYHR